jgi:hypothetical protein
MQNASGWLQRVTQYSFAGTSLRSTIKHLNKVSLAPLWVRQQLQDLQQHPSEAAPAGVPPKLLQEMRDLADELASKFEELGATCMQAAQQPRKLGPSMMKLLCSGLTCRVALRAG